MMTSRNLTSIAAFILVFGVSAGSGSAAASTFDTPTLVYAAAAAVDWATTYEALTRHGAAERNPILHPLESQPALMIATGAAMDALGVWAWNRWVGRKHQKAAKVGLYVAATMRMSFAVYNIRVTH
jgi:hypothetical protein